MSHETYLIFHALAELFTVGVAFAVFMMAWNARRFLDNHFLLFIGIAYFFVALPDLLHTLAYKGMGVLGSGSANPATQLWIAARCLQAISLLAAPFFLTRRLWLWPTIGLFALVDAGFLLSIFAWPVFPVCYDASGMTDFKIVSEYAICAILLASMALVIRRRHTLEQRVWLFIIASVAVTIASEVAFTHYVSVYGPASVVGHLLKLLAFYLIYKALVEIGLSRPYELLFRDQKVHEEALREAEQRYRALAELSPEPMLVLVDGLFVYANRATAHLFGVQAPGELLDRPFLDWFLPPEREAIDARMRRVLEEGVTTEPRESRIIRADGTVLFIEKTSSRIPWTGKPAVQMVMRDVTERRRMERELLLLNESLEERVIERTAVAEHRARQLQRLTLQLNQAEQTERRRLARFLHDHLQQLLAAARLRVGMLRREVPDDHASRAISEAVAAVDAVLREAIQATRTMTFELDPPILREAGLIPALEWLSEHMQEKHGLTVDVAAEEDRRPVMGDELEAFLFQAAREFLFNVVKHAGVRHARVCIAADAREARLTVEDYGAGFDVSMLDETDGVLGGFGLFSIRERLDLLGGRIEIRSAPGQGTCFTIYAPIASDRGDGGSP